MTETMYEIFEKPLSTKNLFEKFEYVLNNEMTQELFNLCCLHHVDCRLLLEFKDYKSRCKNIQKLYDDYYNTNNYKKINFNYIIIKDETVYLTNNLNEKMWEYMEWNDIKLKDLTIEHVYSLTDENHLICTGLQHETQSKLFRKYGEFFSKY